MAKRKNEEVTKEQKKKKVEEPTEDSVEESEEEEKPKSKKGGKKEPVKTNKAKKAKKEESEEEENSEEEAPKTKKKAAEKKKTADKKKAKKEESEEEESETEESEEEETPKKVAKEAAKEESEEEEEEEEEEEKPKKVEADPGFVVKSAAAGKLNVKGKPGAPPARGGMKAAGPSDTLFVKNLSFKVQDDDVKNFFSDCGSIKEIRWKTFSDTGRFAGSGWVQFDSVESATQGLQKNGLEFLGREIKIEYATPAGQKREERPPREKPEGTHTVFIGGCSDAIDDQDIYDLFGSIGTVQKIRWVTDKNTQKFKGIGFVVFEDTESTDKAVAMSGTHVKGRNLRIDFATD